MRSIGINADGQREVLGVRVATFETGHSFLADLVARGLPGAPLVTFDAHQGLKDSIGANLPGGTSQRLHTH